MIVITGGGTGGHLRVAKALALEFVKKGEKVAFVGSDGGADKAWFENANFFEWKEFLSSRGVVNKRGFAKIFSLLHILRLAFFCIKLLKKHKVKAVVSVGGYSSAPASIAAVLARKKLFIHEQNAVAGRLNSLLKRFCVRFFSAYEKPAFAYPVESKFFEISRTRNELKSVLFLGGSQGAVAVNDLALSLAPELLKRGVKVIHQCGAKDLARVQKAYEDAGLLAGEKVEVFAFCETVEQKMKEADVCVGRSGASSLWELVAACVPCVFVPFPSAAGNHQYFNARFLEELGLARIVSQSQISQTDFLELLFSLDLKAMSAGLKKLKNDRGSEDIVNSILCACGEAKSKEAEVA